MQADRSVTYKELDCVQHKIEHVQEKRLLKIACIEDDESDFELLKSYLENAVNFPISLTHFSCINNFLALSVQTPDIIFLDRNLPDSLIAETRIREIHARHDYCPIIMYTECLTPSLRATAAHEGAVAVIEKGTLAKETITDLLKGAIAFAPHSVWKTTRKNVA